MYADINVAFEDEILDFDPVDYELLARQVASLAEGTHWLCALANASAQIMETLPCVNWAGFYLTPAFLGASDDEGTLLLGPFQGKVACTTIAFGRGVCGTAAERDEAIVVKDVHAFPGHIACDGASRSEIVVPIHVGTTVVGVLDIDSPVRERFGEADRLGLMGVVRALEEALGA